MSEHEFRAGPRPFKDLRERMSEAAQEKAAEKTLNFLATDSWYKKAAELENGCEVGAGFYWDTADMKVCPHNYVFLDQCEVCSEKNIKVIKVKGSFGLSDLPIDAKIGDKVIVKIENGD